MWVYYFKPDSHQWCRGLDQSVTGDPLVLVIDSQHDRGCFHGYYTVRASCDGGQLLLVPSL